MLVGIALSSSPLSMGWKSTLPWSIPGFDIYAFEDQLILFCVRERTSRGETFYCNFCRLKFTRRKPLDDHQTKPHTVPCDLCQLVFTGEIFLEEHMNTDHDIKSTSPPPPKKLKSSAKEEGSKKVTKGEKMKEVFKGEVKERVKGEKTKKEFKQSKVKVKSKGGRSENDTVCEVSLLNY